MRGGFIRLPFLFFLCAWGCCWVMCSSELVIAFNKDHTCVCIALHGHIPQQHQLTTSRLSELHQYNKVRHQAPLAAVQLVTKRLCCPCSARGMPHQNCYRASISERSASKVPFSGVATAGEEEIATKFHLFNLRQVHCCSRWTSDTLWCSSMHMYSTIVAAYS